jgi:ATP-dependent Clp protease ATP-binding subunit ClpA
VPHQLFGARPLKRAIQGELENPLAKLIIAGTVRDGALVRAVVKNGELEFGLG